MRWHGSNQDSPIGLDVGGAGIKAVQLRGTGRRRRIAAVAAAPRTRPGQPVDQSDIARLCRMMRRQGFRGDQVVLAAPQDRVIQSILDVPPVQIGAAAKQIARLELARTHRCDPDSFEFAAWPLPPTQRAREGTQLMAVACKVADADNWLDLFEDQGLNVIALESHASALTRVSTEVLFHVRGIVVGVDLGWTATRVLVWYRQVVIYDRTISDAGLGRIFSPLQKTQRLAPELIESLLRTSGLNPQPHQDRPVSSAAEQVRDAIQHILDVITREVRTSVAYADHRHSEASVERILVTGGGAGIPGLARRLGAGLELEATTLSPADLFEAPKELLLAAADPALALALGLALNENGS